MHFENEANLYSPDPKRGGDWYEYLTARLGPSFEKFSDNKLAIITFNYDRSFEHYLLNSLHNWHGRPVEECVETLANLPIIHVYGQLGEHPYPNKGRFPYRPDLRWSLETVMQAASGITLIHEEAAGNPAKARWVLESAECICFLGFGYHELDLSRLAISRSSAEKFVIGTARGLKGKEVMHAQRAVFQTVRRSITLRDIDNLVKHVIRHFNQCRKSS